MNCDPREEADNAGQAGEPGRAGVNLQLDFWDQWNRQQRGKLRVPKQPGCFQHVTALQAGTDGERVSEALRHMLGYICGYGSLLAQTTSLPRR